MKKLILKASGTKVAVVTQQALQEGRPTVINSLVDTKYQIIDEATGKPVKGQVLKKKGKDLLVEVNGEEAAVIHDFYAETPVGQEPVYQVAEASNTAGGGAEAETASATTGETGVVTGGSSSSASQSMSDGVVWAHGSDVSALQSAAPDTLTAESTEGLSTAQMAGLGLGALAAGGGATAIAAGGWCCGGWCCGCEHSYCWHSGAGSGHRQQ